MLWLFIFAMSLNLRLKGQAARAFFNGVISSPISQKYEGNFDKIVYQRTL